MPPTRMKNPIRFEIRMRRSRLAEKKRTIGWRLNQACTGRGLARFGARLDARRSGLGAEAMALAVRRAMPAVPSDRMCGVGG